MYKRFISALSVAMFGLGLISVSMVTFADDTKPNIEDLVQKPQGEAVDDLSNLTPKRAKLTEEQALAQLQYMMVSAFKRNEEDLLGRGSFKPMGMTLDPDGTFRAIRVDGQDEMPQEVAVEALVKALKGLAENRTQWAVGLTYVTGEQLSDGTFIRKIVVAAEHIAGWARSWIYPYQVVEGQVKMGRPIEQEMKPVYYER